MEAMARLPMNGFLSPGVLAFGGILGGGESVEITEGESVRV